MVYLLTGFSKVEFPPCLLLSLLVENVSLLCKILRGQWFFSLALFSFFLVNGPQILLTVLLLPSHLHHKATPTGPKTKSNSLVFLGKGSLPREHWNPNDILFLLAPPHLSYLLITRDQKQWIQGFNCIQWNAFKAAAGGMQEALSTPQAWTIHHGDKQLQKGRERVACRANSHHSCLLPVPIWSSLLGRPWQPSLSYA